MDEAKNLDITMSLYKLIEYSDNSSGSLWQFKNDKSLVLNVLVLKS